MAEEILSSDEVYTGRVLALRVDRVRLDSGRETLREIVRHPSSVGILVKAGSRVLLVRQFRHATGEELLEIPAGKMEPGEEPETAARRELREETGAEAESLVRLGSFYTSPGFTNEVMHLFLAAGVRMLKPDPDADEEIENVWMEEAETLKALRDGRIRDGKTALALLLSR